MYLSVGNDDAGLTPNGITWTTHNVPVGRNVYVVYSNLTVVVLSEFEFTTTSVRNVENKRENSCYGHELNDMNEDSDLFFFLH
jgi:hypothetical protein